MDEVYCGKQEPSLAIIKAVAQFANQSAPTIDQIDTGGAERGFDDSAKLLRESKALCMTESYYGDENLFDRRWKDMNSTGRTPDAFCHRAWLQVAPGLPRPLDGGGGDGRVCQGPPGRSGVARYRHL